MENRSSNDILENLVSQSNDQLQRLKDLLLALTQLSESIFQKHFNLEDVIKLRSKLTRFIFATRNLPLSEEISYDLKQLDESISNFDKIEINEDNVIVIKQEMNKIVIFLKKTIPLIINIVSEVEEREKAPWFLDKEKKAIILKYKDNDENNDIIRKFGEYNSKLISLDTDYLSENISEEKFELLRPIIVAKLSYLISNIVKTSYE